jgi:hypothetical protein
MDCCEHINPNKPAGAAHDEGGGNLFTCPMHPEIVQERPGMCPECGMALLARKREAQDTKSEDKKLSQHEGHNPSTTVLRTGYGAGKHAGHKTSSFLTKFWIALALTVPILLLSDLADAIGIPIPKFAGSAFVSLIL